MKKITLLFALFTGVFCNSLFAQDDSLLVDSIEPEIGIDQMFDSCYKNLNLEYATTGLLIDKAIPTINVQAYSGQTEDTILSDNFAWRRAYGTLRRAFIDSTEAFDTLEKVIGLMEAYQDSGYMPIGIINYQYNRIKSTALEDSLIYVSGIQLFDVSARTESPYEIKPCFMAAPYIHESDTEIITFVFNPAMYFTNDTRTLDHMEVDFGDGNGYVVVGLNSYSVIDYGETHNAIVIVKMVFTNSTTSVSSFVIRIKKQNITIGGYGGTWPDQFLTIEAESLYTGTTVKGKVHVSVRFGCSNGTDQKLRKPFIIVTGYSPPYYMDYKKSHGIPPGNGRGKLDEFYAASFIITEKLYYQDYDMIFVEYDDPTNYVQNNAYAVEEVIKWVNEQKANNGSTHPNVIMGFSMGGIVARYALADMNAKHRANPGTVPNHDVKVFYSYDSPQAGANTPLGLQFMTVDMYKFYNQNRHIIKQAEWDDINWDYKNITCPATRQMLINYYYPSNSLYTAFYSELNSLNPTATDPLKVGCKSVAISNGSGEGNYQHDASKVYKMLSSSYLIHADAGYWSSGNFFGWAIDVWGVPESSSVANKRVYSGTLIYKAIHQNLYTISHYGNALNSHCNGIDGAPGGRGHIDYGAASNTIIRLRINAKFPARFGYATFSNPFIYNCLVPTISAVAATYQTNYMASINSLSDQAANPSRFNDFRTDDHQENEDPTTEFNNQHVRITKDNLLLFLKDLLAEAGSTIETTETFNYGGVTTDKIATVEVKNGAILSINKDEQAGLTPQMSGSTNLNKNYNPDDNTHFQVYTYKFNSCISTAPVITIQPNGTLQIGDNGSNRTGDLIIRSGAKVTLENSANLAIYGNSKLVIEEGAELKIAGTPTILLNDANSVIEIHGKLTLDANAELHIANTSNGHIAFKCPTGSYCNTDIGSNAQINITGATRNDKVIEITGKGLDFGSNLSVFSVEKGTIEMGNNSAILVENDLSLDQVKVTKTSANTTAHKGITINSAQGKNITIVDCYFEYADKGLTKSSTSTLDLLTIETTTFANCSTGLYTVGDACNLDHVYFSTCQTGWQAENMTATSDFKGYSGSNNAFAIDYEGSSTAHLYVYESRFLSNAQAMRVSGGNKLVVRCSNFSNNETDIQKDYGDLLLDNSVGITPSSGSGTVYGGDNTFYNTTDYSISLNTAGNIYVQGHNQFVYTAEPTHIFYGTLGSSPGLDNNYWSIYDGSSTQTNFYAGMWSVTNGGNPVLYSYSSANNWNASGACTNVWDGEIVIEGMARDNTSTGTKEIAPTKNIFVIYPNPTDKVLHVQSTLQSNNYTLKLVDITGRIISLQPTTQSTNTQSFDVSHLAAGLYQVMVEQNGFVLNKQKIVINR